MPVTILKHPDYSFYLLVGFTVSKSDVVLDNAQLFTEPYEAAHKLSTVVYLDIAWLAPTGNHVIIQELGRPPTVW